MFDTELQRRSALCLWPKGLTADGTIDVQDSCSLLGVYPFDVASSNVETCRLSLSVGRILEMVVEITKRYRK